MMVIPPDDGLLVAGSLLETFEVELDPGRVLPELVGAFVGG